MKKDKGESYGHDSAKKIFAKWLRESHDGIEISYDTIYARTNRDGKNLGVYEEYPIEDHMLWDEKGWDQDKWPNYDYMKKQKKEFYIADIAIAHKGAIKYAIEIIHKNKPSLKKILFLENIGIKIIQIPSSWVLNQIKKPNKLPL
jgi:hypothetical protein